MEWVDSKAKYSALSAVFYGGNMMLQTFVLYPFFHIYNYELCRRPTTPRGVPFVSPPHFFSCYSLLLTTAALDNMANFPLMSASQPYRESNFLMQGNSVTWQHKIKAIAWNGLLSFGIVIMSTALAYPAEVKWRRYLVSVDYASRDATVRELWNRQFRGNLWTGFWASCFRNGLGCLILNYHYLKIW